MPSSEIHSMENHDLSARLAALSPAKRALLEQKLKQAALDTPAMVSIPRRTERGSAPLSFAQQRLWFLSRLEPESSNYNEPSAIRLHGPLNRGALGAAINQLVARHEVLRTTIGIFDGEPRQVVNAHVDAEVRTVDLRATPPEQLDNELQKTLLALIRQPFDLARELPLRVLLVQVGDEEHILLKVMHHIASDGWSTGIIWRELSKFYGDYLSGVETELPELAIQYQDYADWQRDWLQGKILQDQLEYWKQTLSNLEPLNLPADRPRAAGQKSPAARVILDLDKGVAESLKALSKQQGVTLFMTLLAAFQTLLHRYCGQDDLVVGTPIAGRTRSEVESLVGFFVNTLVMRTKVDGIPTFLELLANARDTALGAYAHQDIPFEKLVEEINPVRDLDTTPLFQVFFAYQNAPRVAVEFAGIESTPLEVSNGQSKFDLLITVMDWDAGLRLRAEYAVDLFDAKTIERMLDNFHTLLKGIVNDPSRRLSDLPLLTAHERHQVVSTWNDTARHYPDSCVQQLFEAQVEQMPDGVAVTFGDRQLSYQELNCRANQLARYLNKQGVGPEVKVGIGL